MRIPSEENDKKNFVRYLIDVCMASRESRAAMYDRRRRYYLYGQNADDFVKHNRLYSHMGLVASFLFTPEFSYSMSAPRNASDLEIEKITVLQDSWNQDLQDDGIADVLCEAVNWALVYDTMIIKQGWNDVSKQQFATLIPPDMFGVFRESVTDFSAQPAFCQKLVIDYDEACERLTRAGKAGEISKLTEAAGDRDIGLPGTISQLIVAATGGTNIAGNMTGQIQADYEPTPSFKAREDAPLCPMYILTVWDTEHSDFREFTVIEPDIILTDSYETIEAIKKAGGKENKDFASSTNFFLKGENPFTPITPYGMLQYIWGDSHIEHLISLQNWSTERVEQIEDILNQQANPSKVFSGFMGLEDEKAGALGSGDNWVADATPGAKVDRLFPQMPSDLFAEYAQIGELMMDASGLTETVAGKGTGGARGGKQGKQMQITGGGRIRRVAVGLEKPLVRVGDLGVKLKMKNDDEPMKLDNGEEFIASQVTTGYSMRVAGHSHSPLFTMETEEQATLMLKAKASDPEMFIRMVNTPYKDALLHNLKKRQKAAAAAAKQEAQNPQPKPEGKKGKASE